MSRSLWDMVADRVDPPPQPDYIAQPDQWVKDRGLFLWSKQLEILESVRDHKNTAVHSCHNIGKSYISSLAAGWWIDSHAPGSAFVVTSAPSGDQIKAILWRELNRLHKQLGLPGRTNLTEWYIDGELVAMGRKPSDYNPTAFQGIHESYVLVILDEACGIPKLLWDAASSLTSNEGGHTLAVGNPDDPQAEFAEVCKPSSGWSVIGIGAHDTPNFTDEEVPEELSRQLISVGWVEEKKAQWGESSPLYQSKVLGRFPSDSEDGVIPLSFIERCREIQLAAEGHPEAGLDVGAGGDRTVLRSHIGPKIGAEATWIEADPMKAVGEVIEKINEWGLTRVKVDVIGVGWAFAGRLRELSSQHSLGDPSVQHAAEIVACNFGAGSVEPDRFANLRAEAYWGFREMCRLQQVDLSGLDDDAVAELTAPRYEIMDSKGKIKVERKDDVKKRLGVSPDRADAIVMGYWSGGGVAQIAPSSMYTKPAGDLTRQHPYTAEINTKPVIQGAIYR